MTRNWFGGTSDDLVLRSGPGGALYLADGTLTAWSAKTGGIQYTDLLLDGVATDSIPVPTDTSQIPRFQGPDTNVTDLWVSINGGRRSLLVAQGGGGGGGGSVLDVNGKTGEVDLTLDDIPETPSAKKMTAAERTKLASLNAGTVTAVDNNDGTTTVTSSISGAVVDNNDGTTTIA